MHVLAAAAVATGLALLPVAAGPGPEIGQPAPTFKLVDTQGKTHSLADYKGKTVVIEWVNINCPNAKADYKSGYIPKLQEQYAKQDVVWLSVIITEKQQNSNGSDLVSEELAKSMANDMIETHGAAPTAVLVDFGGTVSADYATKTSMHMFVVDKEGTLVYDGALKKGSSEPYVANAIDAAMAGKSVSVSKTKPYGCHPILSAEKVERFKERKQQRLSKNR